MTARNQDRFVANRVSDVVKPSKWRFAPALIVLLGSMGGAGCMQQNQAEVDQLRAQLKATQDELAALKAQQATSAAPSAAPAPAEAEVAGVPSAAPPAPPPAQPAPPFEDAWKAFDKEKRDGEWAVKREKGLLDAAKQHIATSGAAVNSVRCKTTACAIVVDVPEKPKAPYTEMANPWMDTAMTVNQKPTYSKKTRVTYLVQRHTKDYPSFAEQRVDPLIPSAKTPPAKTSATEKAPAPVAATPAPAAPAAAPSPVVPKAPPKDGAATPAAQPVSAPPAHDHSKH
jgi:hypothetical protein